MQQLVLEYFDGKQLTTCN